MSAPNTTDGVSVVIPTTGRLTLLRAVASAQGQGISPMEILVVVDGTPERARSIEGWLPKDVRVLATGKPSNANVARNLGVSHSLYEYVALLDDDDWWMPGKLARQLERAGLDSEPCRTLHAS